ncbi:MAG: energy-coupling factor transporter transmembrane protein EcfT [Symbiobacteriaceae bacterium]|nr:energy-coupling factor transporter transmembrane protein EcfT [Symbiobacteriaceae bacterium]
MLRGIAIGQHYPVQSLLHSLDPRTKIVATLLYMFAVFLAADYRMLLVLGIYSLLAVNLANLPWRILWAGLRPLRWIICFTLIIHSLITPGGAMLWNWWRIAVYSEGILRGILMSSRLILLILTTSLLTLTTSPIALTDGLERLLSIFKPLGFPAHEVAMMLTIALRFIPTLSEEGEKIFKAQTVRGVEFDRGNLLQRLQSLIPVLVPLFIGALRRAEDLAIAMEARCYRGGQGRGRFRELTFNLRDGVALTLTLGVLALTLIAKTLS